jgi:hypothetical protein
MRREFDTSGYHYVLESDGKVTGDVGKIRMTKSKVGEAPVSVTFSFDAKPYGEALDSELLTSHKMQYFEHVIRTKGKLPPDKP